MRMALCALPIALTACAAGFPPDRQHVVREPADPDAGETPGDAADALFSRESAAGAAAGEDTTQLAILAHRALEEGRLDEAASLYEKAAANAPAPEAWLFERAFADALAAVRRYPEAEAVYRRLIKGGRHPASATLHANLAMACFRQGKTVEARSAAEAALKLRANDPEALKTLGLADLREGELERGTARLSQALLKKPRMPEAQAALAALEAETGRLEEAIARYRQLLDWLPGALSEDNHRRWRDLFHPSPHTTAEELRLRIAALEGARDARSRGNTAQTVSPDREKETP